MEPIKEKKEVEKISKKMAFRNKIIEFWKDDKYMRLFLKVCVLIILFSLLYYFTVSGLYPNPKTVSEFGDMFGGLSALFSGLSFAGVIIAILMQMQELKLTRDEMKLTRYEVAESAKAQKGSEEALSQQLKQMEAINTFQMVHNYRETIDQTNDIDKMRIANDILDLLTEDLFNDEKFDGAVRPFIIATQIIPSLDFNLITLNLSNTGGSCLLIIEPKDQESENCLLRGRFKLRGNTQTWSSVTTHINLPYNGSISFYFDNINFESKILHYKLIQIGRFVKKKWVRDMFIEIDNEGAKVNFSDQTIINDSDPLLNK